MKKRWFAVALPWLSFACLFLPMDVMPEPPTPWYVTYTTPWFILAAFVFYPATWLSRALGIVVLSPLHLFACALWAAVLSFAIWALLARPRT